MPFRSILGVSLGFFLIYSTLPLPRLCRSAFRVLFLLPLARLFRRLGFPLLNHTLPIFLLLFINHPLLKDLDFLVSALGLFVRL